MRKHRPVFIIALLALALSAPAQTPPAATQKATIQGTVMKVGTGQPLKRARVSLRRSGQTQGNLQLGQQVGQQAATLGAVAEALSSIAPNAAQQLDQRMQVVMGGATQAVTDDNGRFTFTGVDAGQYRVSVDREGYIRMEYGQRALNAPGTVITLSAGQRVGNIDFQMVPAGSISGRLFNEDSEPLAGVQVQAQTYTYQQGKRVLTPSGQSVPTNDLGEYRIYWLAPGEYYISAVARRGLIAAVNPVVAQQAPPARGAQGAQRGGGLRGEGGAPIQSPPSPLAQNDETYAPTYFPGTVNPESASPVMLGAAAEIRGIDFGLRPTPTVTVRGQVILPISTAAQPVPPAPGGRGGRGAGPGGPGGRGGSQINVMLNRIGAARGVGGGANRTNVRQDGFFDISGVVPGSYNLIATARQDGQQFAARMKVEVSDRGLDNVSIALRPGVPVAGKIFLDGTPPAGFKLSQLRVNLQPTENLPIGGGGNNAGNGQVADDGSFLLSNVSPMEYRVRINGLPAGAYVMAGRAGSEDAVNQPFVIAPDQQVTLQLQIGFSAGRVQGTAVDEKGNPYQGALATLIPDEPRRQRTELFFSSPTDQSGRFSFGAVPPGGYKIFAWQEIPSGAHQDPEFIRKHEDRGKIVKVDANGSVDVQVPVIRP